VDERCAETIGLPQKFDAAVGLEEYAGPQSVDAARSFQSISVSVYGR
jgi:hypothetical protein